MTAVLVHGVPDTDHVWHRVVPLLDRDDVVVLRLPGFGTPLPAGFDPTKDVYAAWLVEQIAAQRGPVDLVGHDWGALLAIRAASLRPDLIRTWAMGGAPLDAEYVWHQAAQVWQTPEAGERAMARTDAETLAKALASAGVPADDAREAGTHFDETMKRSILGLYRSAVTVGAEWSSDVSRITSPGLILWGAHDPYAPPRWGERLAQRTGAHCVIFPGCSHWWPLERPAEVASELRRHWRSADPVGQRA